MEQGCCVGPVFEKWIRCRWGSRAQMAIWQRTIKCRWKTGTWQSYYLNCTECKWIGNVRSIEEMISLLWHICLLQSASSRCWRPRLRIIEHLLRRIFINASNALDTSCKLLRRWKFCNLHKCVTLHLSLARKRLETTTLLVLVQW